MAKERKKKERKKEKERKKKEKERKKKKESERDLDEEKRSSSSASYFPHLRVTNHSAGLSFVVVFIQGKRERKKERKKERRKERKRKERKKRQREKENYWHTLVEHSTVLVGSHNERLKIKQAKKGIHTQLHTCIELHILAYVISTLVFHTCV